MALVVGVVLVGVDVVTIVGVVFVVSLLQWCWLIKQGSVRGRHRDCDQGRGYNLSGASGGQRGRSDGADDGGDQLIGADQEWIEDQIASLSYTVQCLLQKETSYLDLS